MVQFCCGNGNCAAAGVPGLPGDKRSLYQSAKFGRSALTELASSGGGGVQSLRFAVNGTEIQPVYVGSPQVTDSTETSGSISLSIVSRRDGVCAGDWVPVEGKEDYTRPAAGAQIVSNSFTGPVDVAIIATRTQEWSTTMEASLGFADVISLGISFSASFSESYSNSEQATYHLDEGVKGYVPWTSFIRCSEGMLPFIDLLNRVFLLLTLSA